MMLAAAPSGGGVPAATSAFSMATGVLGLSDTTRSSPSWGIGSLWGNDPRAGLHHLSRLDGEVAGGDVLGRVAQDRDQRRIVDRALGLGLGASRVEPASRRRVDRRRYVTTQDDL